VNIGTSKRRIHEESRSPRGTMPINLRDHTYPFIALASKKCGGKHLIRHRAALEFLESQETSSEASYSTVPAGFSDGPACCPLLRASAPKD
jgi:hypothetical protein